MSIFTFNATQIIPATVDEAWDFFSSPANLAVITPPEMKFKILSHQEKKIYTGQQIQYEVYPLLNLKMKWTTLITDVKEKEFFADEQLKGPYKMWRHEHTFRAIESGTEMQDEVRYEIGYGPLDLFLRGMISKRINQIFEFRRKKVEEIFPNR